MACYVLLIRSLLGRVEGTNERCGMMLERIKDSYESEVLDGPYSTPCQNVVHS